MKKSSVIVVIIVVVVLAAGAFALTKNKDKTSDANTEAPTTSQTASNTNQTQNTEQQAAGTETDGTTITYSNDGFSPSTLTVKSGTTVTIKNSSSKVLQFDSNPHPDHTDNPELNVGTVSPGKSATFTVTKTGSHGYHNHLNTSDTGTLVVE